MNLSGFLEYVYVHVLANQPLILKNNYYFALDVFSCEHDGLMNGWMWMDVNGWMDWTIHTSHIPLC